MKKLSIIRLMGLAVLALSLHSCEVDPVDPGGGGGLTTGPSISLVNEAGFVSSDAAITPDSDFQVKITADRGDSPLKAFYLQEDFLPVNSARFLVNGALSGANPKLIVSPDTEGFTWELTIRSQDALDIRNYNFLIEDEAGETAEVSIFVEGSGGNPPIITIGGSGMFSAAQGSLISIPILVDAGSFELSSIAVYENNDLIEDFDTRLFYDDISNPFDSNPYAFPEEDKNGVDRTLFVRASDNPGLNTYRIVISDEFGESVASEFTIDTGIAGTDVTLIQGVLFNRAGPAGTGGLDLDTGLSTGSSDMDAEIRDEGIDGGALDVNWIKNISAVNGTDLRILIPGNAGLSEFFTFADVEKKEQIPGLFDSGTVFENTNADGNLISWLVEVGDMYIAQRDGKFYVFRVTEVNETPDNNDDNYVVDIKS